MMKLFGTLPSLWYVHSFAEFVLDVLIVKDSLIALIFNFSCADGLQRPKIWASLWIVSGALWWRCYQSWWIFIGDEFNSLFPFYNSVVMAGNVQCEFTKSLLAEEYFLACHTSMPYLMCAYMCEICVEYWINCFEVNSVLCCLWYDECRVRSRLIKADVRCES